MTRLVLIHGRDLDGHLPATIEKHWLTALGAGLTAAGSRLRVRDDDADLVFYGDMLAHLVEDHDATDPPVTVEVRSVDGAELGRRAVPDLPVDELRFVLDVVRETLSGAGVTPPEEPHAAAAAPTARVAAWADGWVSDWADGLREALAGVLATLDRLPGLSSAAVLLFARDVWTYLHDDGVRAAVDEGVAAALPRDEPAVVVAHSLGAVVAWSVLAERAADLEVPLLLTMGAPLPVRAVREALLDQGPLTFPPGVDRWVNARDPRDLLALHDITPETFPMPAGSPPVEALEVVNRAPGSHAAVSLDSDGTPTGYLATPEVAGRIARALTA
ncbi:hypothetical protein [Isoptericola sp. BMS4]|uniref:hypothetical protein n=1 Tax=Isoptericola sp. BMS4 TaxID=2527875 RepID=UPI00141F0EDC|nr:hypothetical protein [Isoptericola sp. BMS4]